MRDIDLSAIRARLAGQKGPAFWRSLEEVAETPEFQAMLHREFPVRGVRVHRPGRPPRLPAPDGRVDCAGRRRGVHPPAERADRPLRQGARGPHPGQAALLRHRDAVRRHRGARAGREPHGPADQDRAESGASVHARRHRPLRPGVDPRSLRSGPLADRDGQGRDSPLERAVAGAHERRGGPEGCRRRRPADPVRRGHVPDAGGADAAPAHGRAAGQVDPVRGDRLRQRARRRQAGVRRVRRAGLPHRPDRRDPLARRRPARRRSRQAALREGLRGAASRRPGPDRDDPALRRREHPDQHRLEGRPPAVPEGARHPGAGACNRRRPRRRRRRRSGAAGGDRVRDRGRQGSPGASRPRPGRRRRTPAARRPRPGARHERGARQRRHHGRLHADAAGQPRGRHRRAARPGRRDERRHRRGARHPRRQSRSSPRRRT